MTYRIPPMHCLVAFEAVARHGSVVQAAEELCVTASAVSHRLRQLEESLEQKLFARGASELMLTPDGSAYLEKVRRALDILNTHPARSKPARQRLQVAAPPTFARQILVPRLREFKEAYPEIELTLYMSVPFSTVRFDQADVEIRFGTEGFPGMQSECILEEMVVPVCSPEFLERYPALLNPEDLARVPLLRSPLEPWRPWFVDAGLDWPEPTEGSQFMDLGLLMEAAVNGQGVALARSSLAHSWLEAGLLTPIFELHARALNAYFLVYDPAVTHRPEVTHFVNWLKGAMAR